MRTVIIGKSLCEHLLRFACDPSGNYLLSSSCNQDNPEFSLHRNFVAFYITVAHDTSIHIPSRELTYPTYGIWKTSSYLGGAMLVPERYIHNTQGFTVDLAGLAIHCWFSKEPSVAQDTSILTWEVTINSYCSRWWLQIRCIYILIWCIV